MEKMIYDLQGVRGRYMKVYEDKCLIGTKVSIGSFLTGNITDGEKIIYYSDVIGVQFKKSGLTIGYLQLETASTQMNNRTSNFFNENSFTFEGNNEQMDEVAAYVRSRVDEVKHAKQNPIIQNISAADEIIKLKSLLDSGILSQEEFDAKKKQLLGI